LKISIITVVFNNVHTLPAAIESVVSQEHPDIEYIIIDGGSTDGTLQVVQNHARHISLWISEPDKGIYDAMNKGLRMATGEVVGILNSDDFYESPQVLSQVAKVFENPDTEGVYGDLAYVNKDNSRVIRYWKSGKYRKNDFLWGWMPPHPAFFVRRKFYAKYGGFNTHFRIAADYELMLRFIHKNQLRIAYLPRILVRMRVGGVSNSSLQNRLRATREGWQAWKMNALHPYFFTVFLKSFRKIPQYFLSPGRHSSVN
jgi:glycosyltransferase involved in cell wall biosynthesis